MNVVDSPLLAPYKGLEPYDENDGWRFFGRSSDRQIISANLHAFRLTVLYGASGVGKSSVLHAGVVPELRRKSGSNFLVVSYRSWATDDPLAGLGEAIRDATARVPGAAEAVRDLPPPTSAAGWLSWAKRLNRDVLFVLDQFEEYFLYRWREQGSITFANEFAAALTTSGSRTNFLLSLREDALAGLDSFKGYVPNLFDNYLRLGYLDLKGARDAIERPIVEFNKRISGPPYSVDDGLIDHLLTEVQTGKIRVGPAGGGMDNTAVTTNGAVATIETPFLQVVLDRLWKETVRRGSRTVELKTLEDLGGARDVIDMQLDHSMSELEERDRELAARVFYYLVTPSGTKVSYPLGDLAEYAKVAEAEIEPILDKLAGTPRVLRRYTPPHQESRYEIFHDVLAAAILSWRARYLDSRAGARLTRFRGFAIGAAAAVAVILVALSGVTFDRTRTAQEQVAINESLATNVAAERTAAATAQSGAAVSQAQAEQSRQAALSRQLAAFARTQLSSDPELSVVLAREALLSEPTNQADAAMREALGQLYLRRTLRGHRGRVATAVLSPDNLRVATTGLDDGTARVWDLNSDAEPLVLNSPGGGIGNIAFAPDSAHVVTSDKDGVAHLWNAVSGDIELTLPSAGSALNAVAFSPHGQFIATGSEGGLVQLWTDDGRLVFTVEAEGSVNSIAFSPDDTKLLTAGGDNRARLWDVATGAELNEFAHVAPVVTAAFSPDWTRVVSASKDGTARIWDAETGKELAVLMAPTVETAGRRSVEVNSASFSPTGDRVVTASTDNFARVWDVSDVGVGPAKLVSELRGHSGEVFSATFSGDSRFVVTASRDATARVWEAASGDSIAILRGHTKAVSSASIDVDGERVVTASFDGTARVWQAGTSAAARMSYLTRGDPLTSISLSPDGTRAAIVDSAGRLQIVDASTVAPSNMRDLFVSKFDGARGQVAFSPNSARVLVNGTWDSRIQIFDAATLDLVGEVDAAPAQAIAAAWDSAGQRVVFGGDDGQVKLWDVDTNRVQELFKASGPIAALAFTVDEMRVAVATNDGLAQVWSLRSRSAVDLRGHGAALTDIDVSPDGKLIATSAKDNTVRVWDAARGTQQTLLRGHDAAVTSVRFSPDGRHVLSGSDDHTVRWWDIQTGTAVLVLRGRSAEVTDVSMDAGGQVFASSSSDGSMQVYRCEVCGQPDDLLRLSRERASRQLTDDEMRRFGVPTAANQD